MSIAAVSQLLSYHGALAQIGCNDAVGLSSSYSPTDAVVIRFSDINTIEKWYKSETYQELAPLRMLATDVELVNCEFSD